MFAILSFEIFDSIFESLSPSSPDGIMPLKSIREKNQIRNQFVENNTKKKQTGANYEVMAMLNIE